MTISLSNSQMSSFQAKRPSSSRSFRILFLAPFAPQLQASHGGGRAIAHLLAHVAQRHAVALCYLRSAQEPEVDRVLRERCEVVEEVLIPEVENTGARRWLHRLHVWKELVGGKPLWAIDRSSRAFGERVKTLLQNWQPDIVQIEFHIMGQYLSALEDHPAPRILVQHEPGAETVREIVQSHLVPRRIISRLDLQAWERFERNVIGQVQAVVVFTERDRRTLDKLGQQTPVVQIPLGTYIPEHPLDPLGESQLGLLFVGNFKHFPNVEAADRLIHKIFPTVQAEFPEARLLIVGNQPPATLQQEASENVIVTGFVPDVRPYLDRAALVVVPLRLGGGMRVKVLEALAAGKAVVASPLAVEGLDLANGEQVVLAENDHEFNQAILQLLRHPERRVQLAKKARAWACANLSWERVADRYDVLYQRLLKC